MRTLVGVLFYGESEFYDCLVSARSAFAGWDYIFKVVSFRKIFEAHDLLYTFFKNSDYEILVKLDADIVVSKEFSSVVRDFWESGEKHWAINIWDCYTKQFIPAVHVFSSAFSFSGHTEVNTDAFTEPVDRWITEKRVAAHGSAMNPFEQFRTGLHRTWRKQRYTAPFLESYFERAKLVSNEWLIAGQDCANACPVKFDYGASEIAQMFAELIQQERL